jgi:hypothetical protein
MTTILQGTGAFDIASALQAIEAQKLHGAFHAKNARGDRILFVLREGKIDLAGTSFSASRKTTREVAIEALQALTVGDVVRARLRFPLARVATWTWTFSTGKRAAPRADALTITGALLEAARMLDEAQALGTVIA